MSIDLASPGIGKLAVAGNWLDANGRLPVCVAKPPIRFDEIANDDVVPGMADFARAVLALNANNVSALQTWFANAPGLLLFPEYTFSSQDFAMLDALVREHPTRLMVLAGFGAVLGSDLVALLAAGCQTTWNTGAAAITEHGRYNAGWCWVHESAGNTQCYIFVKNYPDQAAEIPGIQNLQTIHSILRIETEDLVLYPLICSDLISAQQDSPRTRIELSLPQTGKQVAVCTISCNAAPHSGWWRTAIDHVVQMQQNHVVLIFGNQAVTRLQADEVDDRWRCLTGAFISRTRMPKAPPNPLFNMRDVSTEASSRGLVLRNPVEGIAAGLVNWDPSSPAVGIYVWEETMRLEWNDGHFEPLNITAEYYETRRFVERRRIRIVSHFAEATRDAISASLTTIVSDTVAKRVIPRLWPELLDGLKPPEPPRSPDQLDRDQEDLDLALGMFAAVQYATNGQPVVEGPQRGQILWDAKELRVWRSPSLLDRQMINSLEKLALEGGSALPLIVIGSGRRFGLGAPAQQIEAAAQQARPERQTDITHAAPPPDEAFNIESTRLRPVYWRPMSEVEQVLMAPPADFGQAIREAVTHSFNLD